MNDLYRSPDYHPMGEGRLVIDGIDPNLPNLDRDKAMGIAYAIRQGGQLKREDFIAVSNQELSTGNGVLSQLIGKMAARIEEAGGDARSFNRGTTLALILAGSTQAGTHLAYMLGDNAPGRGVPRLGAGAIDLVTGYMDSHGSPYSLVDGLGHRVLHTQHVWSDAVHLALPGLSEAEIPAFSEPTDSTLALAGAGAVVLGTIAEIQARNLAG